MTPTKRLAREPTQAMLRPWVKAGYDEEARKCWQNLWDAAPESESPDARAAVIEAIERCARIADKLIMLPADECNVPYDEMNEARIDSRRKAARHIAAAIRALSHTGGGKE